MDNSAHWPQGFGGGVVNVKGVENPSSSGSIDQQQQKRTLARPQKDQIVNCPRCNSVNTKFCYYNNYSLSQPRYFCKTCRRYWTAGGSLRNVPVGGGSRKNRRSSSSSSSSSSVATNTSSSVHSQASAVANNLHQGHDLNLSFPLHPTTTTHDQLYPNPTFTTTSTKPNFSMDNHLSNTTTTKLLPHHLQNPNSTNMNPLLPPMGLFKNTILAAHDPHSSREMMSSLMNKYPPEHHQHTSNSSNNASIFSNPGFTQIHQGQFKPSSLNFSLDGFSNDNNHNEGYAASCLQLGVQQQSISDDDNAVGMRLLFPFNQQENMNNKDQHQKQIVPSASASAAGASSDNVVRQFDHQHNMINRSSSSAAAASVEGGGNGGDHNGSSAGFWTGMLSGGSW